MNSARAEPTSRQIQREQTRDQILAAAVKIFARSGYEAASLARIAGEAGVKKALVQYHFSTKQRLWQDAATRLWRERNRRMNEALAGESGDDLAERMRVGFTSLLEFTRENPEWLWFMFHEAAVNGERMQWLIEEFLQEDYRLGEAFVRHGQQRGQMRDGSPLHLLHLISGALAYNLLVAPQTLRVTGIDLASAESIQHQVALLQSLLAPQAR